MKKLLTLALALVALAAFADLGVAQQKDEEPRSRVRGAFEETKQPVPGKSLGQGEVETMSPKDCDAQWTIGTHSTGWINLGQVGGFLANKKAQCKTRALQNCNRPEVVNLVKNNIPANQGCAGINVYFDTKVEGKINSKDGSCTVKPDCTCKEWTYKP